MHSTACFHHPHNKVERKIQTCKITLMSLGTKNVHGRVLHVRFFLCPAGSNYYHSPQHPADKGSSIKMCMKFSGKLTTKITFDIYLSRTKANEFSWPCKICVAVFRCHSANAFISAGIQVIKIHLLLFSILAHLCTMPF